MKDKVNSVLYPTLFAVSFSTTLAIPHNLEVNFLKDTKMLQKSSQTLESVEVYTKLRVTKIGTIGYPPK